MFFKSQKENLALFSKMMEISQEYRCIQSKLGHCDLPMNRVLLGVKQWNTYGWAEFSEVNTEPAGFDFYIGGLHESVFEAYVTSSYPATETSLFVGYSTDCYALNEHSSLLEILDYSAITAILSKAYYPKLKTLRLGITELLSNSEGVNGAVGDITELLAKMPNLERLEIGGYFILSRPLHLPQLKSLTITVAENWTIALNQEPSEQCFNHLFESNLPALSEMYIYLNCAGDFERGIRYCFPEKFLNSESTPNLSTLEINGLVCQGETQRLTESRIWCGLKSKFNYLTEACFLAVDVHYFNDRAYVCGVSFSQPKQEQPDEVFYSELDVPGEYVSGEFYKRELPCILKLLEEHCLNPRVIIIDGFVYLDDTNRWGLGAHLSYACSQDCQDVDVIGVAKNARKEMPKEWEVIRGSSSKPLYVAASGLDNGFARDLIATMAGEYRMPTLLKMADSLCRERALQQN